jgi:NADPH2:quinone reductase
MHGAYATFRLYRADRLTVIPHSIRNDEAASVFLKGLAARCLLKEVVALRMGDTVLYHSAAGGVGQIFAQWGRALGLRVIGTVSNDHKAQVARDAGCAEVINYRTENFVERVRALTDGIGVKAVFDSVGKDTFRGSLDVLVSRGTLVSFGRASGDAPMIDPFELAARALYLTWPNLSVYMSARDSLVTAANDLFAAIYYGFISVKPSRVYPFDCIVDAHRDLESRLTTGAAVLHI